MNKEQKKTEGQAIKMEFLVIGKNFETKWREE
jgi:hypothetical protein